MPEQEGTSINAGTPRLALDPATVERVTELVYRRLRDELILARERHGSSLDLR